MKLFIIFGAVNALISVALGAFGAHGLEGKISEHYMGVWEKAVQYQMYHALGMLAVGILMQITNAPLLGAAGWLMLLGIIFFSCSLYILAVSGISILGPSHRSAACCSSLAGYAWSSASSNCKSDGGVIISKNNGFTHYLLIFLLFMAVFAAGSGIVNLIT